MPAAPRGQTTVHAMKGAPLEVGPFSCNGKPAQLPAPVNAAAATADATLVTLVNQMRQALIDVGICV